MRFTQILLFCILTAASASPFAGHDYDPENAEEINELCSGCHGEFGQGGSEGEYPRLAGLPAKYLRDQILDYRSRERVNVVMAPYSTEHELPDQDLLDISVFLSEQELYLEMPEIPESMPSYQKLRLASRVFHVQRFDGDFEKGREIYQKHCRKCHGVDGLGRSSTPQLSGQYTEYLRLQIEAYRSRKRRNEKMEKAVDALSPEDIENLLAWLSIAGK